MTSARVPTIASLAVLFSLSALAHAQDIRRIDDRSLTRERHEREVQANLEIEGEKVQLVFHRETVPGSTFLRVAWSSATRKTTSSYRYLGYDGTVIRFRFARGDSESVLTYFPKPGGRFVLIPEELQHTRLQFEITPMPERGIIQAVLLDNGLPR